MKGLVEVFILNSLAILAILHSHLTIALPTQTVHVSSPTTTSPSTSTSAPTVALVIDPLLPAVDPNSPYSLGNYFTDDEFNEFASFHPVARTIGHDVLLAPQLNLDLTSNINRRPPIFGPNGNPRRRPSPTLTTEESLGAIENEVAGLDRDFDQMLLDENKGNDGEKSESPSLNIDGSTSTIKSGDASQIQVKLPPWAFHPELFDELVDEEFRSSDEKKFWEDVVDSTISRTVDEMLFSA